MIGNNLEEIVVADASADKIYIYTVNGVKLGEFSAIYGVNDGFAVGNVLGAVKDQIFTASAGSGNITVVDYAGNLKGYFKGGFTANDGFAAGDVLGGKRAEVLIADYVSGAIYLSSPICGDRLPSIFKSKAVNKEPLSFLQVVVPDYKVTTVDRLDYVEIPSGMSLFVDGKPRVPFYLTPSKRHNRKSQ